MPRYRMDQLEHVRCADCVRDEGIVALDVVERPDLCCWCGRLADRVSVIVGDPVRVPCRGRTGRHLPEAA